MNEKPIKGFDGYTMDVDTGRVFSYRGSTRKEIKIQTTKRGRKFLDFWYGCRKRSVGFNRLWYCVMNDISLDQMPKDLLVTTVDGKPRLIDSTERSRLATKTRLTKTQKYRIRFMQRKMKELQIMMDYYATGDFKPISAYAESLRDNMIVWFCRYYGAHEERAEEIYEIAYNELEERINKPASSICDILLMIKNLMMNAQKRTAKERRMQTEKAYEQIVYRASTKKNIISP